MLIKNITYQIKIHESIIFKNGLIIIIIIFIRKITNILWGIKIILWTLILIIKEWH
jgi:hypothetical protein